MFIELHMLQNFPPSCLNRDDTNAPKSCDFGGKRRARISSQCWKRAIRRHPSFAENVLDAYRTKLVHERLVDGLVKQGRDKEAATLAVDAFLLDVLKVRSENGKTKVLLFLGNDEVERMTSIVDEHWDTLLQKDSKKRQIPAGVLKQLPEGTRAPAVALFGRMIAENTDFNVTAACHVAHAISTNAAQTEMDFYTAVDDLQPEEETGAGMMGVSEFTSACYYRYANICWRTLLKNLRGDRDLATTTVGAFLRAAVQAIPTGKQSNYAAHNPPHFLCGVVRRSGEPFSMANAFAEDVRARGQESLLRASVQRFGDYWHRVHKMYSKDGIVAVRTCCLEDVPDDLRSTQVERMEQWTEELLTATGELPTPEPEE